MTVTSASTTPVTVDRRVGTSTANTSDSPLSPARAESAALQASSAAWRPAQATAAAASAGGDAGSDGSSSTDSTQATPVGVTLAYKMHQQQQQHTLTMIRSSSASSLLSKKEQQLERSQGNMSSSVTLLAGNVMLPPASLSSPASFYQNWQQQQQQRRERSYADLGHTPSSASKLRRHSGSQKHRSPQTSSSSLVLPRTTSHTSSSNRSHSSTSSRGSTTSSRKPPPPPFPPPPPTLRTPSRPPYPPPHSSPRSPLSSSRSLAVFWDGVAVYTACLILPMLLGWLWSSTPVSNRDKVMSGTIVPEKTTLFALGSTSFALQSSWDRIGNVDLQGIFSMLVGRLGSALWGTKAAGFAKSKLLQDQPFTATTTTRVMPALLSPDTASWQQDAAWVIVMACGLAAIRIGIVRWTVPLSIRTSSKNSKHGNSGKQQKQPTAAAAMAVAGTSTTSSWAQMEALLRCKSIHLLSADYHLTPRASLGVTGHDLIEDELVSAMLVPSLDGQQREQREDQGPFDSHVRTSAAPPGEASPQMQHPQRTMSSSSLIFLHAIDDDDDSDHVRATLTANLSTSELNQHGSEVFDASNRSEWSQHGGGHDDGPALSLFWRPEQQQQHDEDQQPMKGIKQTLFRYEDDADLLPDGTATMTTTATATTTSSTSPTTSITPIMKNPRSRPLHQRRPPPVMCCDARDEMGVSNEESEDEDADDDILLQGLAARLEKQQQQHEQMPLSPAEYPSSSDVTETVQTPSRPPPPSGPPPPLVAPPAQVLVMPVSLYAAPRCATALFRLLFCSVSTVLAFGFFRNADFWPWYVGGHGQLARSWNLSGGVTVSGMDADFDHANAALKQYFLCQGSYHLQSVCFHILSMMFMSFMYLSAMMQASAASPPMSYWRVQKSSWAVYLRKLGQHLSCLVLIAAAYMLSSVRRLVAVGLFALDVSSWCLHLLQLCLNAPLPNRSNVACQRRAQVVLWLHRYLVIPVFCLTRFGIWPALWYSATMSQEAAFWWQQLQHTLWPGATRQLQSVMHLFTVAILIYTAIYWQRLWHHAHVQAMIVQGQQKQQHQITTEGSIRTVPSTSVLW